MESRYHERLLLLDALEILIEPKDLEFGTPVEFEWDILGYDNNYIWL